ncbi:RICIN domain-containing protein [Micromonospora sp. NPDC050397]|uniref:RICIN domain-containing protein n=1 Tax=Micromonospora sp. NPDC050397 TaxID=3364279 RepID=UPI0038514284
MDKLLQLLALTVVAVLAGATAVAAPAQASHLTNSETEAGSEVQDFAPPVYFEHVQSGLCLDGSVSQGVRLNVCNYLAHQSWEQNFGRLYHPQSGLCLDGSVSQGVRLNDCNSGFYQRWILMPAFAISNEQTGRCLDGSVSQGVRLITCEPGNDYQQWFRQGG